MVLYIISTDVICFRRVSSIFFNLSRACCMSSPLLIRSTGELRKNTAQHNVALYKQGIFITSLSILVKLTQWKGPPTINLRRNIFFSFFVGIRECYVKLRQMTSRDSFPPTIDGSDDRYPCRLEMPPKAHP